MPTPVEGILAALSSLTDIESAVDKIKGVITSLGSIVDPPITALLQIKNDTDEELYKLSDEHSSGGWLYLPTGTIPPRTELICCSHDTGLLTGAIGDMVYANADFINDPNKERGFWLTIKWGVPRGGSNYSDLNISGGDAGNYFVSHQFTSGNNATMTYEIHDSP
ncbi:hypothetical protein [Bacillus thuringiensis]|uniref:hypothetical protein n=1 Tax=Bacillus thuringiensis TaxID=1428 RepID=UPI000BFC4DEF|nr:hypothetical protein [Bacillus thuringiensis]PGV73202.1 hypothetical protein COD83_25030 [Bacillus thuringiensis]